VEKQLEKLIGEEVQSEAKKKRKTNKKKALESAHEEVLAAHFSGSDTKNVVLPVRPITIKTAAIT